MHAGHRLESRPRPRPPTSISVDAQPVHVAACEISSGPTTGTLFSAWQATTQALQPMQASVSITMDQAYSPRAGTRSRLAGASCAASGCFQAIRRGEREEILGAPAQPRMGLRRAEQDGVSALAQRDARQNPRERLRAEPAISRADAGSDATRLEAALAPGRREHAIGLARHQVHDACHGLSAGGDLDRISIDDAEMAGLLREIPTALPQTSLVKGFGHSCSQALLA